MDFSTDWCFGVFTLARRHCHKYVTDFLHEFFIVACTFVQFHTFIIVNNYTDINHKMNYNRNRQFGSLEV